MCSTAMFNTERFIVEIEKRPAIYDINCNEYNDRTAKMHAWDEVCQVMVTNWEHLSDEERNVEEKNLRGKWRNIRDYFMKELKHQKTQKPGPAGRKRKKYMYFDQLLFLMPVVENKRSSTNSTNSTNHFKIEDDTEMDNPVLEEYDIPVTQASTSKEYLQTNAGFKTCSHYPKSMCEASLTSFDNEIHDILSSNSSQRVVNEDDYDTMFLFSLLPILRQVPDNKKIDVRIKMQQVLAAAIHSSENK